jgi:predicted HTH transcriptional regulator
MTEAALRQMLDKLIELPSETECIEFKEAKNTYDFAKLGKYFSALANEANLKGKKAAWLIFGVNDKPIPRTIVGSSYRANRSDLDSLKAEIANKTTNRITFIEIYEVVYTAGRVILFEIPALFPTEIEMYDPYVIRESLHNCIAHQDYTLAGKVIVVEFPKRLFYARKCFRSVGTRFA